MSTVTIQIKDLKAVAYAMAVKDVRYYLNGVCVEINHKGARLIATDGNRLHIVICDGGVIVPAERVQRILPRELVKRIIGCKVPKGALPSVVLSFEADRRVKVSLPDGSAMTEPLVDGRFPDYRRLIPSAEEIGNVAPANIDPRFIADAYRGLNAYLDKKPEVWSAFGFYQRGDNIGFLTYAGYLAMVMPLRECVHNKDLSAFD